MYKQLFRDAHGKTMRSFKQPLAKGVNEIQVRDLGSLSAGTYVLQVITNDGMKSKRIIKLSNKGDINFYFLPRRTRITTNELVVIENMAALK
ncbi:MAG TPA: T9SS type A sorting domain-containing protein [Flavitalea sp.]|nr:T9SS type A sorting domain-containing protein [Flavitalea sp.]